MTEIMEKILKYLLASLCLIAITGAAVYRFYALNFTGVSLSLFLTLVGLGLMIWAEKKYRIGVSPRRIILTNTRKIKTNPGFLPGALFFSYAALIGLCFRYLFAGATVQAIISPWESVAGVFFFFYAAATAVLVILILVLFSRTQTLFHKPAALWLLFFHYLTALSAVIIVYRIGFGFDPFVHGATMELIDKTGAVEPKPFYYLGQYALIVIFHKISFVSIAWLQKLLVPLLTAIFLPWALLKILARWFGDIPRSALTVLGALALPFSVFIVTTPQNLAYLFLLLAIILGLSCRNPWDLLLIYLLGLAALATQPVAGIPAVMFALLLTVYHSDIKKIKPNLYRIILFLNAAVLPAAFFFFNRNNAPAPAESGAAALALPGQALSALTVPGQENFILNFVYLYGANLALVIGILAAVGIYITWINQAKRPKDQQNPNEEYRILPLYLATSVSLFVSFFLTKRLPFDFLIYYERGDYANRILFIAALFLLPFILIALYKLINSILRQNKFIKYSWLLFFSVLISASLYLSYPRFDNYFNSRGLSVSADDISAVHFINEDAGDGDYIVLANQQVSAAALKEFGFKKYYSPQRSSSPYEGEVPKAEGSIFYYPIPTGGELYQYYLDMVYKKPERSVALAAADLVGADIAYFVLNKYWWAFPKILNEAKLEADSWQEFNNEVFVFKYKK